MPPTMAKLAETATGARVIPRGAGVSSRTRGAGGGKYYPSANSKTKGRRNARKAAIESS